MGLTVQQVGLLTICAVESGYSLIFCSMLAQQQHPEPTPVLHWMKNQQEYCGASARGRAALSFCASHPGTASAIQRAALLLTKYSEVYKGKPAACFVSNAQQAAGEVANPLSRVYWSCLFAPRKQFCQAHSRIYFFGGV